MPSLRGPRRRPTRRLRRHARVAVLAIVAAAGVAFVRPTDLQLPSAPAVVAPTAAAAAETPTAEPAVAAPSAAPTEGPAAVAGASAPAPIAIADLPADAARRRAQAWEPPTDPALLDGYVWPLPHGRITDPFGPSPWGSRVVNGELFHDGIDVATFCGDRVVAAHSGIVLAAGRKFDEQMGWVGDLGPYLARLDQKSLWWTLPITVVIDDGNGYRSMYAHFWRVTVKVGQRVGAGQLIGYEGATGRASGCHLHYGLFSPHETATVAIEPSVVRRILVPAFQIARIDPMLVLPDRPGDEATSEPEADPAAPRDGEAGRAGG